MKPFSVFLCALFFYLFNSLVILSQKQTTKQELDSLRQLIGTAQSDTSKIKLNYYIGLKAAISRLGYWDSTIYAAHVHNLPLIEQKAYIQLGFYQLKKNMSVIGIHTLEKSIAIAAKMGNKKAMLSPLKYLASYYNVQNNFKQATDHCLRALKIAEDIHDKNEIATVYSRLADIYFQTGDYKRALQLHLKCLAIFEQLGNRAEIAWAILSVGTDYDNLGDTTKVVNYYLKSLKYAGLVADQLDEHIFNAVAAAYIFKNQYDSAYYYSNKSFEISRRAEDSIAIASTMMTLAFLSFKRGDIKKAEEYGLHTLVLAKSLGFNAQIPTAARLLKDIYLKRKNYRAALEIYELYVNTKDSISNEHSRKQLLEKEYTYNLHKKEDKNRLLTQQNQIQLLKLRQNKFTLIILFGLLGFIIIIAYLLMRQNKLKAKQQSAVLEQKLLRSQMNPHFIFNSLQAIQNFILKRNEKEAARYLSAFAHVTRNVLESSRMEFISLKKEISLLDYYLQLQKLRFDMRFDYVIHVHHQLDTEHWKIPPMLAQPFIENAVEHGMRNIESGGMIEISYSVVDNHLKMEIKDNGYGIDPFRQTKKNDRRSMALEITRERLNLLNKGEKRKIDFQITDAFPEQIERKGVKINFSIPAVIEF